MAVKPSTVSSWLREAGPQGAGGCRAAGSGRCGLTRGWEHRTRRAIPGAPGLPPAPLHRAEEAVARGRARGSGQRWFSLAKTRELGSSRLLLS